MHKKNPRRTLSGASRGAGIGVQAAGIGSVLGVSVLYICFFLATSQSFDQMVDFAGVSILWLVIGLVLTFCTACPFGVILGSVVGAVLLIATDSKYASRVVIVILCFIVGILSGLVVSQVIVRLLPLSGTSPFGFCELASGVLAGSIAGGWYGIKITVWINAAQTNSST